MLTQKERNRADFKLRWDRYCLDLGSRTHVMGVLNCTPDSFSDGGKYFSKEDAIEHAIYMAQNGADIIDIGGESTRPGSLAVTESEELKRVIPVIDVLSKKIEIPISIDTSKASVADAALRSGASMVNDITGLKGDPRMAECIATRGVPVVIMHMQGTPKTMQVSPKYDDLIVEIIEDLRTTIEITRKAGIDKGHIIIDPGIGFGKRLEDNLKIIKELYRFKSLGLPILIGTSRKSFIGQVLGAGVDDRMMGTACSIALAITNGANIVRVHDVKEMRDVISMADSICKA
ncbi:MAG: dihydropteroate synthase [Candidatus Omnitrophica bacterium]|nr:dihydropteroate synthase [Candidatus Omnitrophota bacterium]